MVLSLAVGLKINFINKVLIAEEPTLSEDFSLDGVSKIEPKDVRLSLLLDLEVGDAT